MLSVVHVDTMYNEKIRPCRGAHRTYGDASYYAEKWVVQVWRDENILVFKKYREKIKSVLLCVPRKGGLCGLSAVSLLINHINIYMSFNTERGRPRENNLKSMPPMHQADRQERSPRQQYYWLFHVNSCSQNFNGNTKQKTVVCGEEKAAEKAMHDIQSP